MIRRRLCYLLLLAADVYFIMLYDFQGLRFLFCCIICIPFLSFLFLIPAKVCCRIGLEIGEEEVVRGEMVESRVTVENRGVFPLSRVLVELHWKEAGKQEVKVRKWLCGMGVHARKSFLQEFPAVHCGTASLVLAKASVYDYLGLFSLPLRGKRVRSGLDHSRLWRNEWKRVELYITPVVSPVASAVEEAYSRILCGASEEKDGDLLLRDFQTGDSLHRVYWKLTAKGGDLQVRDFEKSSSATIFLHFSDELRRNAEAWDRYLDRAVSLLHFFTEECRMTVQVSAEVVWQWGGSFFSCQVPDGAAAQAWIRTLLRGEAVGLVVSEERIPLLEREWHLEEDCRLYFGEQCVYEE